MADTSTGTDLVSVETLAQLHELDVAARAVVDGLHAGAHRSPYKGHSVDFADHRPYVPGDDLRHLDWKVLGRSDRLVLKRYEAETDLGCTMVVDGSGSMAYQGERAAMTKYRYASILAASVTYLVLQQQDRVGLQLFHDHAVIERKPSRHDQLTRICHDLQNHTPELTTNHTKAVEHISGPDYRRGLVIAVSDCMVDPSAITDMLDRLCQRGHDTALVWLMDPDELDLEVSTVSRFQDLEGDLEVVAEPRALRAAYAEQVAAHRLALQKACRGRGVILIEASTAEAPQHVLNRLLVNLQHQS